jgi:hypothetical protein
MTDTDILIQQIQERQVQAEKCKADLFYQFSGLRKEDLTDDLFRHANLSLTFYGVSATTVAIQLEKFIKLAFWLTPAENRTSGDCRSASGRKIEIKTSSNYKGDGNYYIKRIRMFHDLTDYILHFFDGCTGDCFWFLIPAPILYEMGDRYKLFNASTTGTPETNKDNKYVERQFEFLLKSEGHRTIKLWEEMKAYRMTLQSLWDALLQPPTEESKSKLKPTASLSAYFD